MRSYISQMVRTSKEADETMLMSLLDRAAVLDQLKILTRDPINADPLYTEEVRNPPVLPAED